MAAPPRSNPSKLKRRAKPARKPAAAPRKPRKGKKPTTGKRSGPLGVEYRRVYSVGNSLAVTLAPACLRLLGVQNGGTVQVAAHPSGKVIIAPMRMRIGAQRGLVAAAAEVVQLRRVVTRLRHRLQAAPARTIAQGVSIGFAKAWGAQMMDLTRQVEAQGAEFREFMAWLRAQVTSPDPNLDAAPSRATPSEDSVSEGPTRRA